jgi:ADP-glucose pyrophosphorylase
MGYVYSGYWADIVTIRAFDEVNLEMASPNRPLDFYISGRPDIGIGQGTVVEGAIIEKNARMVAVFTSGICPTAPTAKRKTGLSATVWW